MADKHNPLYTSDETTTRIISTDRAIKLLGPSEAPIVSYLGLSSALQGKLEDWPQTKYRWFEDAYALYATAHAASVASDATTFTVTTGHGHMMRTGSVLKVDSEYMLVTSISGEVPTVTRAFWGSSAASHAAASVVTILTQAAAEYETATDSGYTVPVEKSNYTQIFRDVLDISRTEQRASRYGVVDERSYRMEKKRVRLMQLINQQFYDGVATESSTLHTFGGINAFITTNTTDGASARLDENALNSSIQSIWNYGGRPDLILCGAFNKRLISSWYSPFVRTEREERVGGVLISRLETEFGMMNIMMDRFCPTNKVWILSTDYIGFVTFDDFQVNPLAKTGDGDKEEIVGEFGLIVMHDKYHALIDSVATS